MTPKNNALSDFSLGFTYFFKALGTVCKYPMITMEMIIPILITVLIFPFVLMLIFMTISDWAPQLPEITTFWSYVLYYFYWSLYILGSLGVVATFLYFFSTIVLFISAPMADPLTSDVEKHVYGIKEPPLSWGELAQYTKRTLWNSFKLNMRTLLFGLLLIPIGFIPFGFILIVLVMGYFIAANGALPAAEHAQMPYEQFRLCNKENRAFFCGVGTPLYIMTLFVPCFLCIFVPLMTIAGTLAFHDRILKTPIVEE